MDPSVTDFIAREARFGARNRLTLTSRAFHNEQLALFYEDIASRR
jgi:hypothetical protein